MQAGADYERAEEDSPDPETQGPQPVKLETPTQLPSNNAKSEPARRSPIKIQAPKADTPNFRRFLAGLFGVRVEGISGEIEGPPPTEAIPADAITERSTQVTAPVEPAPEVHTEEIQPAPQPARESVNSEAASWPRKPPPEDEDWDYRQARKTWTATIPATSRLVTLGPKLHAQGAFGGRISGVRQIADRTVEFIKSQRRWVTTVMVLVFVAAVPIAFLTLADGDLNSLARLVREIIPGNSAAIEADPNIFGRQQTPTDEANVAGLLPLDDNRTPGTDFSGAYVFGLEHLSANSSMLQIFVPAGVEGTYLAIVSASEGVEYKCVILHHYTDRLHCIGPSLPQARQINLRIFRIDEVDGSQDLVFETNYTTGEFTPLPTPTPVFPTYGGAFIWPDRFDRVEILKEQRSSALLALLSALLSVVLLIMYRRLSLREHRLNRRLVESHDIGLLH